MKINGARNAIAIISGKGGSGKSTITTLLAHALKNAGYSVGILDADITGSSIPLLLGDVDTEMYCLNAKSSITPATINGFQVVSMSLITTDESVPILWDAAYTDEIMLQTIRDVAFDVDYLIIDLPPGTGSLNQTIIKDVEGIRYIFVTKNEEIVRIDVLKSISMVKYFDGEIVGMIENFADDFDRNVVDKVVVETDVKLIGKVPTLALDGSKIEYYQLENGFMNEIVEAVTQ